MILIKRSLYLQNQFLLGLNQKKSLEMNSAHRLPLNKSDKNILLPKLSQQSFHGFKNLTQITTPLIQKMHSLHESNMKALKKYQFQADKTIRQYTNKKTKYFKTIYLQKQNKVQNAKKSIQNKSKLLLKQHSNKFKKHFETLSNTINAKNQQIMKMHQKQNNKIEQASNRRSLYRNSLIKFIQIKKPDRQKIYEQDLQKSLILSNELTQKQQLANTNRKLIYCYKRGNKFDILNQSIRSAQKFVQTVQHERKHKMIQKSIEKMKQTQRLMTLNRQKIRSNSQNQRKIQMEKLQKAQNFKKQHITQLEEKLTKELNEKKQKINNINQRKSQNLQHLAASIKKLRYQHQQQIQQRLKFMKMQTDERNDQKVNKNHQKWMFLTSIKMEQDTLRNRNLYESQQASLRG